MHPFRRHRWHVVSVDWNLLQPGSLATAICTHPRCASTYRVEYPGANLTIEAVRPIFPRRSFRASR